MKIININTTNSLTVDSTLIKVDSTTITVDTTNTSVSGQTFIITMREEVDEVEMIFWNELKQTSRTITGLVTNLNGLSTISFNLTGLEEAESFEVTINKTDGSLLWRGKAFATSKDRAEIQDYKMNTPDNNNIITI